MQEPNDVGERPIMAELIESAAGTDSGPWRSRASHVGAIYTMSYSSAVVALFDYDREQAGGLPKNSFLMAAKPVGDGSFTLLRVLREARLPSAATNDQTRQESIEDTGNETPWSANMPAWVRDKMSLHALECSVLGTFIEEEEGSFRFAEDIANYYAVNELMAWKPDAASLELIVNHQHRTNDIGLGHNAVPVGRTRFAAAETSAAVNVDFRIDPTDILKRRTAYFGMSRSGKSNGIKILAESIYRLRGPNPQHRIGQLIFDLSGEYAQDNFQDGKGLHRVHEALEFPRGEEVATYGLIRVDWDPDRVVMKLNFYGDPLPRTWTNPSDTVEAERALEQLLAGKVIVKELMAGTSSLYTTAFRDVDLTPEPSAAGDYGAQTRYHRAILAYRTALYATGLTKLTWEPSIRAPGQGSLFSKELIAALGPAQNAGNNNLHRYHQAATILEASKNDQHRITWDQLVSVFEALALFVDDRQSGFVQFERNYISDRKGEAWADPRFRSVLRIFESRNGPRSFQSAQDQHDPSTTSDFAEAIVDDLRAGKLVVVDQSAGDPEYNKAAAERVMWQLFNSQQARFREAAATQDPTKPPNPDRATDGHVIVYIEEAHNLLPRANAQDNLTSVWARSAKEGSKLNMGMVLATQAPSSVMPEILSETDN